MGRNAELYKLYFTVVELLDFVWINQTRISKFRILRKLILHLCHTVLLYFGHVAISSGCAQKFLDFCQ